MSSANPTPAQETTSRKEVPVVLRLLTLLLRIGLGLLFAMAGIFKLLDVPLFFASLMSFEIVDANTAWQLAWALPILEVALGLWLLSGFAVSAAAGFGFLLTLAFTSILFLAWTRGLEVDCACFGPLQIGSTYTAWFLRNICMGIAFLWIAWRCRAAKQMI